MGPTMAHDGTHHTKRVVPTERSAGGMWCYECGAFLERQAPSGPEGIDADDAVADDD